MRRIPPWAVFAALLVGGVSMVLTLQSGDPGAQAVRPRAPHDAADPLEGLEVRHRLIEALHQAGRTGTEAELDAWTDVALYLARGAEGNSGMHLLESLQSEFAEDGEISSRARARYRYARSLLGRVRDGQATGDAEWARAEAIYRSGRVEDPVLYGRLLQQRANLARNGEGMGEALRRYREALAYREDHLPRDHPDLAWNELWLGYFLFRTGEMEEGLKRLGAAERRFTQAGLAGHHGISTIAEIRGNHAVYDRRWGDAEAHYRRMDAVRRQPSYLLANAPGRDTNAKRLLAYAYLMEGKEAQAWALVAESTGPSALSWRRESVRRGRGELLALRRALDDALDQGGADRSAVSAARREYLAGLLRSYRVIRESRHDPVVFPTLGEVREMLPEHVAVMHALEVGLGSDVFRNAPGWAEKASWFSVLTKRGGLTWVPHYLYRDSEAWAEFTDSHAQDVSRHGSAIGWPFAIERDETPESHRMTQLPQAFKALRAAGVREIWSSPNVSLGRYRFDGGKLIEHFSIVSLPSTALLREHPPAFSGSGALAFAPWYSDGEPGRPRLPLTAREAQAAIAQEQPGVLVAGEQATVSEFARRIVERSWSIVHIATHGSAESASLLFHPADGIGGLSVDEMLAMDSIEVDTVVLSGCRTLRLGSMNTDEPTGLISALFALGSRRVIASEHPVPDRAASLLFERFYELRATPREDGRRRTSSEALREAGLWLRDFTEDGRRPFSHPSHWGGYSIYGFPESAADRVP